MFKKIWDFLKITYYFFSDSEDNLIFRIMEDKAKKTLKHCKTLQISEIEELENLAFHIKVYYEIPKAVKETKFPNVKDLNLKKVLEGDIKDLKETDEFMNYINEVELQRSIERDFVFEHAKALPFGFQIDK